MYLLGTKYVEVDVEAGKKDVVINGALVTCKKIVTHHGYVPVDRDHTCSQSDFSVFCDKMLNSLNVYRMNKSKKGGYYLYDSSKEDVEKIKVDIEKAISDLNRQEMMKRIYCSCNFDTEADTFFGVYDNVIIIKDMKSVETLICFLGMKISEEEVQKLESKGMDEEKIKYIIIKQFLNQPYQFLHDYIDLANGKPLSDEPKTRRPKK